MRRLVLAAALVALSACGPQAEHDPSPSSAKSSDAGGGVDLSMPILGGPKIISIEERRAGLPKRAAFKDAKSFAAARLDRMFSGSISDFLAGFGASSDSDDLYSGIKELADAGDPRAQFLSAMGDRDKLAPLAKKGYPPAVALTLSNRLQESDVSEAERAEGLKKLRGLGGPFAQIALVQALNNSPSQKDKAEGARMMASLAMQLGDPSIISQTGSKLFEIDDPALRDDRTARVLLEALVRWRSVAEAKGKDESYDVSSARVTLAKFLEQGRGGAKDEKRAIALYKEAYALTENSDALEALNRLGQPPQGSASAPDAPAADPAAPAADAAAPAAPAY